MQNGLIPTPSHIFLSKAPRRLPEIVSAEERSRTWDAHQVNEAELIVLPMDWLSKKQSRRVMPTAMGLGMANLTMDCETLKEHRCAGSCSGWCQFLHGLVARQYALREVHSQACRIRPCNALSFTLSVVVLLPTPQLGLDGRRQNSAIRKKRGISGKGLVRNQPLFLRGCWGKSAHSAPMHQVLQTEETG